jgi:hypothetical protein
MWIRFSRFQNQSGEVVRIQACVSYRCAATRKPKTRLVQHLGTIPADGFNLPHQQLKFWLDMEDALRRNLTLSTDDKRRVRALVAKRIGRPRISGINLPLAV